MPHPQQTSSNVLSKLPPQGLGNSLLRKQQMLGGTSRNTASTLPGVLGGPMTSAGLSAQHGATAISTANLLSRNLAS